MTRTSTLAHRYTYGNFSQAPLLGPEADFFLGMPARQRELVSIAKEQIAEQKRAAQAIVESNAAAAGAIQRELGLQTKRLEEAIQNSSRDVSAAISELGDRISGELCEIRWELIQLRGFSEQMLAILKRPRSTEARELLDQGIRNLTNDKLEQAEERFKLALRLDNTDFQVLMNLSAVELRKNNASQAIAFVQDALTLPVDVDVQSRAEALWHFSRIYYAAQNYGKAFEIGQKSVTLVPVARRILQLGVYAILGGHSQEGLSLIAEGVNLDPQLFAVAVSTPDLSAYRQQSLSLLTSLLEQAVSKLRTEAEKLFRKLGDLDTLKAVQEEYVTRFRSQVQSVLRISREGSYSECRKALVMLEHLRGIPELLKRLDKSAIALSECEAAESSASRQLIQARDQVKALPTRTGWISLGIAFVAQCIVTGMIMSTPNAPPSSIATQAPAVAGILIGGGPFWLILVATLLAFRSQRNARINLVNSFEKSQRGLKDSTTEARSRYQEAKRLASTALDRGGC